MNEEKIYTTMSALSRPISACPWQALADGAAFSLLHVCLLAVVKSSSFLESCLFPIRPLTFVFLFLADLVCLPILF